MDMALIILAGFVGFAALLWAAGRADVAKAEAAAIRRRSAFWRLHGQLAAG